MHLKVMKQIVAKYLPINLRQQRTWLARILLWINSAICASDFSKELKDFYLSPGFKRGVTTTKVKNFFERILKGQMGGFSNLFYYVYFLVSGRDTAHKIR